MPNLTIHVTSESANELAELLQQSDFEFKNITPRPPVGAIWASDTNILEVTTTALPWTALATVVVAWLRAKRLRRAKIITSQFQQIETEGMSAYEVTKILETAHRLELFDVKQNNET